MKKVTFKSYEELPLMLSVPEMAAALGISRAGAYELARTEGFPALKIGTRIVIPKDKLMLSRRRPSIPRPGGPMRGRSTAHPQMYHLPLSPTGSTVLCSRARGTSPNKQRARRPPEKSQRGGGMRKCSILPPVSGQKG